jgi:hypothetical protein
MKVQWNDEELHVEVLHQRISENIALGRNIKTRSDVISYSAPVYFIVGHIFPRGGVTTVTTTYKGNSYSGQAVCSIKDNYDKRIGRKIAIGRMLQKIKEDYE